ncbi:MAG: RAD55 family ATPase [Candidatus Thorarchaeota archaeon]
MSLDDMLAKGRELYKTGIDIIDTEVPEGFPKNAFGVIRGPGGGGKSVLLNQMARYAMNSGKKAIYVCFEDTPLSVLQNLCYLGSDHKKILSSGMIHLIDCFSSQILRKTSKFEHTTLVRDPTEPDQISDAIHSLIMENGKSEFGGIFVDSITELFLQSHPFKAVNAVKAWRATFCKDLYIPCWATYHTGLQQFAAYDDMITYSSDIIVDTRHEPVFEGAGVLIKQFRVTKVKGAPHNPMWVTFEVDQQGIRKLTLDELRAIARKISTYEAGSPKDKK